MQDLTYADDWLENEIKKKKQQLSVLNQRTRELPYTGDGMIPMTNNAIEPTYDLYPPLTNYTSFRPVSSHTRLTRMNINYDTINEMAFEAFFASADEVSRRINQKPAKFY